MPLTECSLRCSKDPELKTKLGTMRFCFVTNLYSTPFRPGTQPVSVCVCVCVCRGGGVGVCLCVTQSAGN